MLAHDITFNRFLYISKYSLYLRSTKFCRTLLSNYQDCTVAGSNYPASTTLQRVARNGLGRESIGESAPTTHRPLSCNKPKQCLPKSPIRRASKKKKTLEKIARPQTCCSCVVVATQCTSSDKSEERKTEKSCAQRCRKNPYFKNGSRLTTTLKNSSEVKQTNINLIQ